MPDRCSSGSAKLARHYSKYCLIYSFRLYIFLTFIYFSLTDVTCTSHLHTFSVMSERKNFYFCISVLSHPVPYWVEWPHFFVLHINVNAFNLWCLELSSVLPMDREKGARRDLEEPLIANLGCHNFEVKWLILGRKKRRATWNHLLIGWCERWTNVRMCQNVACNANAPLCFSSAFSWVVSRFGHWVVQVRLYPYPLSIASSKIQSLSYIIRVYAMVFSHFKILYSFLRYGEMFRAPTCPLTT